MISSWLTRVFEGLVFGKPFFMYNRNSLSPCAEGAVLTNVSILLYMIKAEIAMAASVAAKEKAALAGRRCTKRDGARVSSSWPVLPLKRLPATSAGRGAKKEAAKIYL